jgi:glyoxylase-like metal-dependent hydrolase (beta-lactamase superfamily II)
MAGFLIEPPPPYGTLLPELPDIGRVVAANPGRMTYHGTNTWLVEDGDGVTVIDPGPEDATHIEAVLAAARGRIRAILLTHTHRDHVGGLAALRAATGAPVGAFAPSALVGLMPDVPLADAHRFGRFTALHTPGHAADHLCFATSLSDGRNVLFSGDHVMSWSSSVISPPGGDMADYMRSLSRLAARDDAILLSGHGPLLPEPRALVRALIQHRAMREMAIAEALGPAPRALAEIRAGAYPNLDPALAAAAERTTLAHLEKLAREGRAVRDGDRWRQPD